MAQSGSPAVKVPGVFHNYAVGRSRARATLLEGVFSDEGLSSQVDRFLADAGGTATEDALYIIWIGGNDVADALGAFIAGEVATGMAIVQAALDNTANEIGRLYYAGARQFLIANIADFALTPRVTGLAARLCALHPAPELCQFILLGQVSAVSAGYNGGLQIVIGNLALLTGTSVKQLDVASFLYDVTTNPEQYGLENVTESCVEPDTLQQVFCPKPVDYLFWDGQHPTRTGHSLLADYALETLW